MNYYPFHIGDYASATRHLNWDEDCAYRRLLDVYYTSEKPLPAELRAVCRLAMATTEAQRAAVQIVLEEFFELTPAGWVNSRADAELHAMREKQQKQRDKANKRWQKLAQEHGNASAMPRHEEIDATASKNDADAMPPTPTPTPTPTPNTPPDGGGQRKRASTPARPDDVPESVWQDFQAIRKAKRAPLTDTALEGIRREAAKAGLGLGDAIAYCCEAGWQGFNAGWYADRTAGSAPARALTSAQKSFAQQEREVGWARWEEMTGRQHPDRLAHEQVHGGLVLDVSTNAVPTLEIAK